MTAVHTDQPQNYCFTNPHHITKLHTSLKASACPAVTAQNTRLISNQISPPAAGHSTPAFASCTTHAIQQLPPPCYGSILICTCAHRQLFHSNTDALLQSLCCTNTSAAAFSRRPLSFPQLSPCAAAQVAMLSAGAFPHFRAVQEVQCLLFLPSAHLMSHAILHNCWCFQGQCRSSTLMNLL